MHKLLERQLKRTIGSFEAVPEEWKSFLEVVDEAYRQADIDRTLLERSLDLTSEELFEKNQQLQQQVVDLQRTQETLSKRASELELVVQVSTDASTILDTQELLQTVVDLTKERFGLYHVHIYLLDDSTNRLVLAAGAGEVGQQMVSEGWSIPLEREQSLVVRVARSRQGIILGDVRSEPDWLPNPLLPETRSELAVPLLIGDRLLGVLDVQLDKPGYFTDDDIRIQNTLAIQVAIALENARLFEQAEQAEEALRVSEERFALAVQGSNDGLWDWDIVNNTVYWSPRLKEMLGYADNELDVDLNTFDSLLHPDDREQVKAAMKAHLKDRVPLNLENRIRTKSGEYHWHYMRGQAVWDETGQALRLVGSVTDITERKRIEEALRENEARLSDATNIAQLGYWEFDFQTQIFTFTDQLYALLRTTAAQEGGYQMPAMQYAQKFVHPDDAHLVGDEIQKAIETTDPNYSSQVEHRIIRADGSEGFILVRFRIIKDVQGRTIKSIGANQDITERKQAEEALRESEDLFAKAFHAGPTPMAISQVSDAVLIDVNQRWEDQWGYRREEVIGRTAFDLNLYVDPNDRGRIKQLMREQGRVRDYDLKVRLKSGELHDMLMSLESVEIHGGSCFLITFYDITQQKQAEETLTKRAAELETVAQVSTAALNVLDTTELLQTVVNLTRESFDLYHAHIYLLDEITDALVLAAGAGKVGLQMVAEGWNIPFEQEQSLVARAARTRQGVIVNNVREVPDWLPNPLLPDTHSELAVPLIVGGRVLGVLDVQSEEAGRFTDDDIRIQTTLAAQVAVALENARLFEEGQQTSYLLNERIKELDCLNDIGREMEENPPSLPELLQWITERIPPALQYPDLSVAAIEFDGQVYGVPEAIELPNQITHGLYIGSDLMGRIYISHTERHDFIDEESALLGGVATRISGFIENQRLLEQSQQRSVELERVLAEVRRLAAIVENHPDFIGIGTLEGKIHYVNPAGLKMMGLPPDYDVTLMNVSDFCPPADAERLLEEGIYTALQEGFWSTDEANLLRADGTTIPVEETVSINYDVEGEPSTISITMHDITNRMVAESEQRRLLAEVEASYRQYVRQEWEQFLEEQHQGRWLIEHQQVDLKVEPPAEWLASVRDEVIREGETRIIKGTGDNGDSYLLTEDQNDPAAIIAPISLRGQVIGTLNLQDIAPDRNWTAEEIALVEAVSEQLALTVENLRLFDDTQRRAAREQLTRQITDKIHAAPDVDSIIQTGLTELAKSLKVSRTYVKLNSPQLEEDE